MWGFGLKSEERSAGVERSATAMTLALPKLDLGRLPADSGADTARLRELEIERQHRAISGADKAPFFYHSW